MPEENCFGNRALCDNQIESSPTTDSPPL
jgi:hypothetical protein